MLRKPGGNLRRNALLAGVDPQDPVEHSLSSCCVERTAGNRQVADDVPVVREANLVAFLLNVNLKPVVVPIEKWRGDFGGRGQFLEQGREQSDMAWVLGGIMLILVVGIGIELLVFAPLERWVLRSRGLLVGAR